MKIHTLSQDEYEILWTEWQYEIAKILKRTLEANNVSPTRAQKITGEALFDISMLHDQGGISYEGAAYQVWPAFLEDGTCNIGQDAPYLHEFAFGNADLVYEENPPKPGILQKLLGLGQKSR